MSQHPIPTESVWLFSVSTPFTSYIDIPRPILPQFLHVYISLWGWAVYSSVSANSPCSHTYNGIPFPTTPVWPLYLWPFPPFSLSAHSLEATASQNLNLSSAWFRRAEGLLTQVLGTTPTRWCWGPPPPMVFPLPRVNPCCCLRDSRYGGMVFCLPCEATVKWAAAGMGGFFSF